MTPLLTIVLIDIHTIQASDGCALYDSAKEIEATSALHHWATFKTLESLSDKEIRIILIVSGCLSFQSLPDQMRTSYNAFNLCHLPRRNSFMSNAFSTSPAPAIWQTWRRQAQRPHPVISADIAPRFRTFVLSPGKGGLGNALHEIVGH
jgi:hypothetical protein